jgi:hypothetical protein
MKAGSYGPVTADEVGSLLPHPVSADEECCSIDSPDDVSTKSSHDPKKRLGAATVITALLLAGVAVFGVVAVSYQRGGGSAAKKDIGSFSTALLDIEISVSNEYGTYMDNMFDYPFLREAMLMEPYKETTFRIENHGYECTYTWMLINDDGFEASGDNTDGVFTATAKSPGKYELTIAMSCDETSKKIEWDIEVSKTVWVKYIRRELATLHDADRNAFLDAYHTLWQVNTVEGQRLYGDKYKSLFYFASIHVDAGSHLVCDEVSVRVWKV